MKYKVLLAYSGGLDTSCILKWLLEKQFEVYCFMADVGQDDDLEAAKQKALKLGATDVIIKDLRKEFVEKFVWPAIQMGLIYEGRYLMGTSLARPCITVGLINAAKQLGCNYISHGATGKGNDQIRFELSAYALYPDVKVIAPWRSDDFCNRFRGRGDLIDYAKLNGIPISATPKEPWSTDGNIMHISYESGILEDPSNVAPANIYSMTRDPKKAPDIPYRMDIHFECGLPVKVSTYGNKVITSPIEILIFLNQIGGEHGVGRIDIVENRFIGMKSRGVYETPGATILYCAHHDLEMYCLDKEVIRVKSYLRDRMADYVYNGLWFSPEAEFCSKSMEISQKNVNGRVTVELFKGHVWAIARESSNSLYNEELVSMDVHGHFNPASSTGFIEVNAIRLKEYNKAFGVPNQKE